MSREKYGKRRQITFRITALADERLKQVAQLFNLTPAQYAKACLYRDLGCFLEPLDRRKTRHKRRRRVRTWELADEEVER